MAANIFLITWIICSLLIFFIMIPIRKVLNRKRSMPAIQEYSKHLGFGPLLIFPLIYIGIRYFHEQRRAKIKERMKALEIIRNRFEILDL